MKYTNTPRSEEAAQRLVGAQGPEAAWGGALGMAREAPAAADPLARTGGGDDSVISGAAARVAPGWQVGHGLRAGATGREGRAHDGRGGGSAPALAERELEQRARLRRRELQGPVDGNGVTWRLPVARGCLGLTAEG
jgi:hypothetical protein